MGTSLSSRWTTFGYKLYRMEKGGNEGWPGLTPAGRMASVNLSVTSSRRPDDGGAEWQAVHLTDVSLSFNLSFSNCSPLSRLLPKCRLHCVWDFDCGRAVIGPLASLFPNLLDVQLRETARAGIGEGWMLHVGQKKSLISCQPHPACFGREIDCIPQETVVGNLGFYAMSKCS